MFRTFLVRLVNQRESPYLRNRIQENSGLSVSTTPLSPIPDDDLYFTLYMYSQQYVRKLLHSCP